MIIENDQKTEVIKGGNVVMEEKSMRIKASAKAFKVLSDSLYSDKIFAVIREVGCNACDAHVDADKPETPFEVVLPNSFNPNFIVRDFGTGISDGDMDSIYTVFFESTKTDASKKSSYDSTGMLGLGCKSPLSYTDSFVVESFMNGVKNSYSIYKNEDGIPCCVRMSTEDSDEPTGLKVTIPVKSSDFTNFSRKAKTVFTPFKVKPIITGNDITIPEPNYFVSHEQFGLRPRDWGGPNAIMGNIAYPLSDLSDSSLTDMDRKILGLDADIFFDLGQLDFSASRERLSYDKTTIANILTKVRNIANLLEKSIIDSIEECDTLWDARVKYAEIVSSQNLTYICENMVVTYKGVELGGAVSVVDLQTKDVAVNADGFRDHNNFSVNRIQIKRSRVSGSSVQSIQIHEGIVIVVDDAAGKRLSNRIRTYYDKCANRVLVYVVKFNDDKYIDELKALLGITDFLLLSEMEFVSLARGSRSTSISEYNPKYSQKMFLYTPDNHNYGDANSKFWTSATVEEDEPVLYVTIDRFKVLDVTPDNFFEARFKALEEVGIDPTTHKIYGIKPNQTIPEEWIPYDKFVKQEIQIKLKDNEEFKSYCLQHDHRFSKELFKTPCGDDWKSICIHMAKHSIEPKFSILNNVFHKDIKTFKHSRIFYGHEDSVKLVEDDLQELINVATELDATYPMLSCVSLPSGYYGICNGPNVRQKVLERVCDYVKATYPTC